MRKGTVLGLAAVAITTAALWPTKKVSRKGLDDGRAQAVDQTLPLSIDQFDEQIDRIESGAAECAEIITAKLNKSSIDPRMHSPLTNPFEIASRNAQGNSLRNVQRQREAAAGLDSVTVPETHFFYEQLVGQPGYAAAYSPAHKTMKVPKDFFLAAEPDAVDCLIAGHEYRHVGQDIVLRRGIDSDQKNQVYLKMRQETLIISDEVSAYAFELEHLDLLLDGDLSKNAGKMDFDEVAARLKTKYTANVSPLRTLLNMAPFYYIDYVSPLKALSPIFFEHVADLYRSMGAKTLLMNDGTGRLRPYRGVRPNR